MKKHFLKLNHTLVSVGLCLSTFSCDSAPSQPTTSSKTAKKSANSEEATGTGAITVQLKSLPAADKMTGCVKIIIQIPNSQKQKTLDKCVAPAESKFIQLPTDKAQLVTVSLVNAKGEVITAAEYTFDNLEKGKEFVLEVKGGSFKAKKTGTVTDENGSQFGEGSCVVDTSGASKTTTSSSSGTTTVNLAEFDLEGCPINSGTSTSTGTSSGTASGTGTSSGTSSSSSTESKTGPALDDSSY